MIRAYLAIEQNAKAKDLIEQLWKKSTQYLKYYCSLSPARFTAAQNDCVFHMYIMNHLTDFASIIDEKLGNEYNAQLNEMARAYTARGGRY
jgi:hypothetical protein